MKYKRIKTNIKFSIFHKENLNNGKRLCMWYDLTYQFIVSKILFILFLRLSCVKGFYRFTLYAG